MTTWKRAECKCAGSRERSRGCPCHASPCAGPRVPGRVFSTEDRAPRFSRLPPGPLWGVGRRGKRSVSLPFAARVRGAGARAAWVLAHGCARCAPWEGQGAERCHRGRGCRGHPGTSRRAGARVRKLTWAAAPRAARKGRVEAWRATGREVAGRRAGGPGRSSAGLGDRRQPRAWGAWADGQAAGGGGQWSSPGRLAASLGASSGPLGSRTEGPRAAGPGPCGGRAGAGCAAPWA